VRKCAIPGLKMRTNVPHIFAIGDVIGQPILAHKAVHEAQGRRRPK
jgi:pyruvate/2-oxoglutarate dehydrogenase complex dihydrolipoamide dehydrogenase (E3) component